MGSLVIHPLEEDCGFCLDQGKEGVVARTIEKMVGIEEGVGIEEVVGMVTVRCCNYILMG